jgi:hypothetical protein
MEERATISRRAVQVQFEPRRNAAELLAEAYRLLGPPNKRLHPQVLTVHELALSRPAIPQPLGSVQ